MATRVASRPAPWAVFWLLLLLILNPVSEGLLRADDNRCPPPRGMAQKVPGKDETGWKLSEEMDQKGNVLQLWCLEKKQGVHGGPDAAGLWKPAGAKDENAVWVGACVFFEGVNKQNKQFDPNKVKNGVPEEIKKVSWLNIQPPPLGTNDWDYNFDTGSGILTVKKRESGRESKIP